MQAFSGLGRGRGPEGSPWRGTPVTYKSSLNPCFSLLPLEARKSMRASALKCCPRPHPFTREFLQHSSEGNVFVPFHCKKERNPRDFPGGPVVKTLCSQCRSSIPGLGKSLEEGMANPLQYSCLENPMERRAWWVRVHGVAKNQT